VNVYIAGPMSNYPYWNFPQFQRAEQHLRDVGHRPINPARNFGGRTDLPWHVYIGKAMQQVACEADAMFMLGGWENSEGARLEALIAYTRGLPFMGEEVMTDEMDAYLQGIIAEAREKVYGSRNETYGDPSEDFSRQSEIAEAMGVNITTEQVPLFMMAVKLSREVHKPKRDNLVDLAGYVLTMYFNDLKG